MHQLIVIMGVSGSGKSTIAHYLSEKKDIPWLDADDFHPPFNIAKMKNGVPLSDEDRWGWLQSIRTELEARLQKSSVILACSALKEAYRQVISAGLNAPVFWVFMKGDFDVIWQRVSRRKDHFMPPQLLQSQFDTLEIPEYALNVDIRLPVHEIIHHIEVFTMIKKEFGLVGLGIMGKSLARNLGRNGVSLALWNRRVDGKEEEVAANFIREYPELSNAAGFEHLESFVASLETPGKYFS